CLQRSDKLSDLVAAKLALPQKLPDVLPADIRRNELLMRFLIGLISPDPNLRFHNAEAAEHMEYGAAAIHRQLVIGDMSTEYSNDIRLWLEELRRLEVDT
ncbi:MAG: serine/threonine protein kinase, partial [Planctomycetota bacterium]